MSPPDLATPPAPPDEEALPERVLTEARPAIERLVRSAVRREDTAEDLEQEISLGVLRALPAYDPRRPLLPWVHAIARNRLRDHWRASQYRASAGSEEEGGGLAADPIAWFEGEGPTPEEWAQAREEEALVRRAVGELPATLRDVVQLRAFEGLSFEEVGQRLGRTAVAVRKRYSRALDALRGRLAAWIRPESSAGQVCEACPPA